MFPDYSRSRLKSWLLDGAIRVDGLAQKPRDRVHGGEWVEVDIVPEAGTTAEPEPIALDVVYEDEALLVIDKPPGLVVHPGAGNPSGTLMNGLLYHAEALVQLPRAGIVHRLDKDTGGLLLVGKTLASHTALVRMMADRQISRRYVAVCCGVLTGGGTIDAPIGRHPVDRTRMAVRTDGRPAVTHYTVRERYRAHSCVDVRLATGRTHQIRVHFAARRHPLLGDPVYGGRLALPAGASEALVETLRRFRRQALHASRLELAHPVSGEPLRFDCDVPEDFESLLEVLRQDAACQSR